MRTRLYLLSGIIFGLFGCSHGQKVTPAQDDSTDQIVKIEMHLSAFGVESDDFPSIDAVIDFVHDTSVCVKSYYHPDKQGATYALTKSEMDSILKLLRRDDLEKLKPAYEVEWSDQPRSTTEIYTTKKVYRIDDYGLKGEDPLKALYRIVYQY
jgi:hypothetical protein